MRIHHVALRVADLDRAEAFYGTVLQLRVARRLLDDAGAPRAVWLIAGEAILMLELKLGVADSGSGTGHVLALAVEDLGLWAERLAAAGVSVESRSQYTLYVRDPDGHSVGLSVFELS